MAARFLWIALFRWHFATTLAATWMLRRRISDCFQDINSNQVDFLAERTQNAEEGAKNRAYPHFWRSSSNRTWNKRRLIRTNRAAVPAHTRTLHYITFLCITQYFLHELLNFVSHISPRCAEWAANVPVGVASTRLLLLHIFPAKLLIFSSKSRFAAFVLIKSRGTGFARDSNIHCSFVVFVGILLAQQ